MGLGIADATDPSTGWSIRPLGDLGRWLSGGTPSLANESYWSGDIPWVSPKDMKRRRLVDASDHISEGALSGGARLAPRGALLMVVRGMILAHSFPVGRAERSLAFNQDIKALVPGAGVDSEFMLWWLQAHRGRFLSITTESTHGTKRIPSEALFAEQVSLPPLPEQRAIATALSDVDALIDSLEMLIAKKRAIKTAAMQQLLTGRRRLPGFGGEWASIRLADVAPLQRGFDLPTSRVTPGRFPVVYSSGILRYHNQAMIAAPGVVTGRSGTIGVVHFVRDDYWPHNTALWVTDFCGNDPKYIFYMYSQLGLQRLATGSGVPTLNRNDVHPLQVSIPLPPEQQAIATVLSDMDAEIAALEARGEKTKQIKQGMMQELLTGRTRLVPPEESAAQLVAESRESYG